MMAFTHNKRSLLVIFCISLTTFLLTRCIDREKKQAVVSEKKAGVGIEAFAGSASCARCHQDIYEKHIASAHYLTSTAATEATILGSFEPGRNFYQYSPATAIRLEKRDSGLFQVVYHNGEELRAVKFDIVTGSGAKGQSFLHWHNQSLYQMPLTYYTAADQWANSPGFPNQVVLNRVITSRCLECHTTFAETISPPGKMPEQYNAATMLLGVDCEKCHGPAEEHVSFHTTNKEDTVGRSIVNPATLSRKLQLDLCALCHGGALSRKKPSFSFTAGHSLEDFFVLKDLHQATPNFDNIDVHGNQYGLLSASKCFTASKMTCNSCHDPHEKERGNKVLFSQRCMNCHQEGHENFCRFRPPAGIVLKQNCIDCHMPAQRSQAITLLLPGASTPRAAMVRSHYISIYPEEVKKFIKQSRPDDGR